jgi:MFS family permease
MLLQTGQLLSSIGTQSTSIAYPLLVLDVTRSPAKTGIVSFVRILPAAVLALPTGVAADRWNRKRLMVVADAVRVLAIGVLAAAIVADRVPFWAIVVVALVEGTGATLFSSAYTGALRSVVPLRQLPAAAAARPGGRRPSGSAGRRSAAPSSGSPGPCRSSSTPSRTRSRRFRS